MKNSKIIAVHLLNDFSGSPFVLQQALSILVKAGYPVALFTATPSGNGFLSNCKGVQTHSIFYKWSKNKLVTLFLYLYSQVRIFIKIFRFAHRKDIVYINSLLPFGAALAAKLKGTRIIYHIHEVSLKPALLKRFLLYVAKRTADKAIFVSEDLCNRTSFSKSTAVIYNTLPTDFIQEALQAQMKTNNVFTVLMICSLKKYKGVFEFLACAQRLPMYKFNLVLNADEIAIAKFFTNTKIPKNVHLIPTQKNVHPYYQAADVVVNLSKKDEWIETFGMTILEAMYYKKPVIVPKVGGVIELVSEGVEGFRIDSEDIDLLCTRLEELQHYPALYQKMSMDAYKKALQFSPVTFKNQLLKQVSLLQSTSIDKRHELITQLRLF